jgi:hypothetical protein
MFNKEALCKNDECLLLSDQLSINHFVFTNLRIHKVGHQIEWQK